MANEALHDYDRAISEGRARRCVTHHYACDCHEAAHEQERQHLLAEIARLTAALVAAREREEGAEKLAKAAQALWDAEACECGHCSKCRGEDFGAVDQWTALIDALEQYRALPPTAATRGE